MQQVSQPLLNPWQRWAHRLAFACSGLTLLMIIVGAMVTTIRAGDTDPTWSWRFWEWAVGWWQSQGGRAYELGHRVIGTIIGFCLIGFTVAQWRGETGPRRWLGVAAMAVLVLQGVLGGVRVLVVSEPDVRHAVLDATGGGTGVEARRAALAMAHGVIGQVTFAILSALALLTSRGWLAPLQPEAHHGATRTRGLARAALGLALLQLFLGTVVRQTSQHVMLHVGGAFLVSAFVLALVLRIHRLHGGVRPVRKLASLLGFMLLAQVFMGLTPWMLTQGLLVSPAPASVVALLRTAHVTTGALLLVVLALLGLWLRRLVVDPQPGQEAAADDPVGRLQDYWVLTKARLSSLVLVTVAAGYLLASRGEVDWPLFVLAVGGVGAVAGGTGALNQVLERDRDARMERTRNRPIPSGRVSAVEATLFGILLIVLGASALALGVNLLSAALALATSAIYLGIYTPLKTRTTLNTLIGAVPGALPPVIGWTAVTNELSIHAFVLFAILFVWQLPHFWSIAWLYRKQYEEGGMRMLGWWDPKGGVLARQITIWSAALLLTSLLPVTTGMAGITYAIGALALGLGFLGAGVVHAWRRSQGTTRGVFVASLLYLPLLLLALLLDAA